MKHSWHETAVRVAAVAGVFSALVLAILAVNGWRSVPVETLNDGKIAALKQELRAHPKDEGLKTQLREIDLQLRQGFFHQREMAEHGAILLIGGLLIFILAVKIVKQYRFRNPKPQNALPDPRPIAAGGRYAVAVAGFMLAGVLAGLALLSRNDVSSQYLASAAPPPEQADYPSAEELAKHWPAFRGPGSNGVATSIDVPATWDGKKGTNILWKAKVPLPGENSPVVWGDVVFLSGANEHQREVYCFDANTGALRWKQPVTDLSCADKSPLEVMEDTGYAAPTMVTDGKHAAVMFANGDLACFDFAGKRLWAKNMGKPDNAYGHATSLAMHKNKLILQFDQGMAAEDGKSALIALDKATGKQLWKTKRPVPNSWSTPIVINTGAREEIITCANPWVIAYNPEDGKELWRAEVLGGDVAPVPVFAGGLVFAVNSGSNLAAIKPGGTGNVTKSHVAWTYIDDLPDIVSPVSNGELVYIVYTYGTITCLDAKTGKMVWTQSVDNEFNSSPTVVGDRIFLMDKQGVMHFLSGGRAYKELGKAALGEPSNCSPAFVNGRIYIRGKYNLYCIGKKG
ncbi:MAG: outer membrane protein assembly factor BamB family protein [Armatimonadota bacterium]